MREYFLQNPIPQNVWLGTTVESQRVKHRIDLVRDLEAKVKWLSCEPLISDLGELDLSGIDWVIVGGESGPKCRVCKKEWVVEIQKKCEEKNIPFFFKQWGGTNKKKTGEENLAEV